MVFLNPNMILAQEIGEEEVDELHNLHQAREEMFRAMAELDPVEDTVRLKMFVVLLESLEYNMQRVWRFDQDRSKQTWWNRAPHCTCRSTATSFKLLGFDERITNADCPLHGNN